MPQPARRRSAEERREEVVGVALRHFAAGGYHGTSTEAIAKEAGISQPYLFRLFRTKRELFLACSDAAHEHLLDVFRTAAAAAPPEERLKAMGHAYIERLLPDEHALRFQMQSYAAASDAEIQAHVRRCYGALVAEVRRLAGATDEEAWRFFAQGMLLNVIALLDVGALGDEHAWARAWASGELAAAAS